MQHLTWRPLTTVGLASAVLAWLLTGLMVRGGATPLMVPWSFDVMCVAAGAATLGFGWQVRQYLHGNRPSLDGLRAARIAVLAQATAYVGVIIMGASLGYGLGLVDDWGHGPRRDVIISALVAAGAALIMTIAGIVAERWCRHGGGADDAPEGSAAEPA
ncbi:DUF3180 domain-containing protein [Demequina activiva]|uniref:DUF3180 domain-containing protein n=1 Tax=Demequina activiva TaxID=1582364 RepID=A0A919Q0M3_9MICO|nr:DUF3180 domain-containing protein [Demequina activiva]GIG53746.1 hypothetical protein Dac01nite_04980 [Demequina activiva]